MRSERNVRAPTARRSVRLTGSPPDGVDPVHASGTGLPGRSPVLQESFQQLGGPLQLGPLAGVEMAEALGEIGVLVPAAVLQEPDAGGRGRDARHPPVAGVDGPADQALLLQ